MNHLLRLMSLITALVCAPHALADGGDGKQDATHRIARVELGLPAVKQGDRSLQLSLSQWMEALAVPGVSIAVIDDYRIAWAKGYGVTTLGAQGFPVTQETIFQAASIAKPLAALAMLRHVERGSFELDTDINDYLRSWRLPDSELQGGEKATIRRLLAHTGGITPGGFQGYPRTAPLPSIVQVLEGVVPATNAPARVMSVPGAEVAYSGLGYSLLQLALEDRLHEPFEAVLQDTVVQPLQLGNSSFNPAFPETRAWRVSHGHIGAGLPLEGGWLVHPELAAAGLWTTPADLATLIIDVANSKRGGNGQLLSPGMARQMLSVHKDGMGLGFVVRDGDTHGYFAHSGGNEGYFAHFEMLADTGQGIVIMTNADAGQALASLIIASVANEYDWPLPDRRQVSRDRAERLFARIDHVATKRVKVDVDPALLARYVGKYELAPGLLFDISLADRQLKLRLGEQPQFPLFAESDVNFFLESVDAQITFVLDASGSPTALILHQGGRNQDAAKVQ